MMEANKGLIPMVFTNAILHNIIALQPCYSIYFMSLNLIGQICDHIKYKLYEGKVTNVMDRALIFRCHGE